MLEHHFNGAIVRQEPQLIAGDLQGELFNKAQDELHP